MKEATYEEAQARLRDIERQKQQAHERYEAMHTYLRAQAAKKSGCTVRVVPQGTGTPDSILLTEEDAAKVFDLIMSLNHSKAFV